MERSGAMPASEAAAFELLGDAKNPKFKESAVQVTSHQMLLTEEPVQVSHGMTSVNTMGSIMATAKSQ
jgi:hypothetical protein